MACQRQSCSQTRRSVCFNRDMIDFLFSFLKDVFGLVLLFKAPCLTVNVCVLLCAASHKCICIMVCTMCWCWVSANSKLFICLLCEAGEGDSCLIWSYLFLSNNVCGKKRLAYSAWARCLWLSEKQKHWGQSPNPSRLEKTAAYVCGEYVRMR